MTHDDHQTLLILDFGSQYTQLIARRVREHRVYCEIHPPTLDADEIERLAPRGIVLSGGPDSVYGDGAPQLDPKILQLDLPILGVCYGMQLLTHHLGGEVQAADAREYGRAEIKIERAGELFFGLDNRQTVWMSHGDRVERTPPGFDTLASTDSAPVVAMANPARRCYGIQFHPEVSHTVAGADILHNFLFRVCRFAGDWLMSSFLDEAIERIRAQAGGRRVICGLSGGVDSSVMAALVKRAVGDRLTAIFVDRSEERR